METNITLHVDDTTTEINYISLRLITTYIVYLIIHCKKKNFKIIARINKRAIILSVFMTSIDKIGFEEI